MIELSENKPVVRLFASEKCWIEGEALRQLRQNAELEGMEIAVGMPDLHPGRGNPVGAAFVSKGIFYPYLVGNDVGCGMGFWKTTLKAKKAKRDKWVKKLSGIENPWDGDIKSWLSERKIASTLSDTAHGTIGGGNHFAELQVVEKIFCQDVFKDFGLDNKYLFLLVHSGSRGIGEALLRKHTDRYGAKGLIENSEDAVNYMKQHDFAVKWAASNRSLIAHRFIKKLGGKYEPVLDLCHNSISKIKINKETCWLHRKGTAPSDKGPILVPGSRGTLSYLVKPVGDQEPNLWSLAHGAGRKWNRSSCKDRLKQKCNVKSLTQTSLGSCVICENRDLLYEEAPQAYKNIDVVIKDMKSEGLIDILATFRPLITYKMRQKA